MNRDDVIRMAREAGFVIIDTTHEECVERFAALVAAAEREACAKVAETYREWDDTGMGIADAIRARWQV